MNAPLNQEERDAPVTRKVITIISDPKNNIYSYEEEDI
tara:strand:+ start:1517 stop:1630 length:114 start_codon:yes stop_codon:yes gene_type:complete